jgi:hypothetical protein
VEVVVVEQGQEEQIVNLGCFVGEIDIILDHVVGWKQRFETLGTNVTWMAAKRKTLHIKHRAL